MYKNILKYILIFLVLFTGNIYSQLDTFKYICATTSAPSYTAPSLGNLPHKTATYGENLRIMVVFVKFNGDNTTGNPDPYRNIWSDYSANKPTNPYTIDGSFIDGTEGDPLTSPYMTRYRNYTVSDYFCEMSRGDLDVIGEGYYVETINPANWYKDRSYGYGYINSEVLQTLEASGQAPNFSLYNNWTLNSTTNEWEWHPATGDDNTADMIVMVYRIYLAAMTGFLAHQHRVYIHLDFPHSI